METKNWLTSKTIWLGIITSVTGVLSVFLPSVGEWVTAHNALIITIVGGLGIVLRFLTNGKIGFGEGDS